MSSPRQNGKHRVRRWLPYLGLLAVLGLIIAGFWPQPVPVETSAVSVGGLRATVNEEGKTRIKQRYTVSLLLPDSFAAFLSRREPKSNAEPRYWQ